jgi:hypothetical protein
MTFIHDGRVYLDTTIFIHNGRVYLDTTIFIHNGWTSLDAMTFSHGGGVYLDTTNPEPEPELRNKYPKSPTLVPAGSRWLQWLTRGELIKAHICVLFVVQYILGALPRLWGQRVGEWCHKGQKHKQRVLAKPRIQAPFSLARVLSFLPTHPLGES